MFKKKKRRSASFDALKPIANLVSCGESTDNLDECIARENWEKAVWIITNTAKETKNIDVVLSSLNKIKKDPENTSTICQELTRQLSDEKN